MKKILKILSGLFCILMITAAASEQEEKTILFFGDSLTAGYGLDPTDAFPNLIREKIKKEGLNYKVISSGLSGETSAGGLDRIDWVLNQPVDIFILELGANDGLRGLPLDATEKNLQEIISKVKTINPNVIIVLSGMMVPPNMGENYSKQFVNIYSKLSKKNNTLLIPFLLEDVAGNPDLNLPDGIHPNVEGQKIVAGNVWKVIEPVL
jgi:acyl-CoA thioesterase I